jgi:hypothetical protein
MADMKPPAGWYPHPSMADTRRYWDGTFWTDHIQAQTPPVDPKARDKAVKRVALFVGLLFLAPVLVLTFVGPSVDGVDCGNWIAPRFTKLEVARLNAEVAIRGGGAVDRAIVQAGADECNNRIESRRVLVLVLIALGITARLGIPPVARALRN